MKALCYEIQLRPDFLAQLILPRDLTKVEADRICALVQAVIGPPEPVPAPTEGACATCGGCGIEHCDAPRPCPSCGGSGRAGVRSERR